MLLTYRFLLLPKYIKFVCLSSTNIVLKFLLTNIYGSCTETNYYYYHYKSFLRVSETNEMCVSIPVRKYNVQCISLKLNSNSRIRVVAPKNLFNLMIYSTVPHYACCFISPMKTGPPNTALGVTSPSNNSHVITTDFYEYKPIRIVDNVAAGWPV